MLEHNIKTCLYCASSRVAVECRAVDAYHVVCYDCGTIGPTAASPEQAIQVWNNAPSARIEAEPLREVLWALEYCSWTNSVYTAGLRELERLHSHLTEGLRT